VCAASNTAKASFADTFFSFRKSRTCWASSRVDLFEDFWFAIGHTPMLRFKSECEPYKAPTDIGAFAFLLSYHSQVGKGVAR